MPSNLSTALRFLRRLAFAFALIGGLGLLAGDAGAQQRGPIQLFPDLAPEEPTPREPPARELPGIPAPGVREVPGQTPPVTGTPVLPTIPESPAPASREFQVERLDAPDLGVIGLDQGFGPDIWRGSDARIVLDLLAGLPVETRNPPLRELTRRLLITGAGLEGEFESGRLLELRLNRLIAMGALADAAALLERLPAQAGAPALARQAGEVALWRGENDRACSLAEQFAPETEDAFWGKLVVFCRLRSGDDAGALLALDLLREAGQTVDQAFFDLAGMVASGELDRAPPRLPEPSALHLALLRQAELPLPEEALAEPSPALLAALVATPTLTPGRELELAEAAFHAGVLSDRELVEQYLQHAPAAGEAEALPGPGADWGAETRASARAQVQALTDPAMRADLLVAAWQAASGADRILVGRAFAEPFTELPAANELLFAATSSARALLAAERPLPAARWFSLLRGAGGAARAAGAGLAPLFALAGIGGSEQVPEPDLETLAAWQSSMPDAADRAPLLLALLDGIGAQVPTPAWWDLPETASESEARLPTVRFWRALDDAQAGRRQGETLLVVLHLLGGEPAEAHPEAVVRGLSALRASGFDQEARAIALASAIAQGL